jgi:tripartite-type tricarboxylate transporter receptor subunit TctC
MSEIRSKYSLWLIVFFVVGIAPFLLVGNIKAADKYPIKPIQLIAPWKAGGGTDLFMRIVAKYANKHLEKPMVVVNIPGVGGTLGARKALQAKPDGYTIVCLHETLIGSNLAGIVEFTIFDFLPIAGMAIQRECVAARPGAPWKNMKELVADAKKRPGKITFGATIGSTSHFFPLQIADATGIEFKIVGYEGTADRQMALLGGHIDLGSSSPVTGKKYFDVKKLVPLGYAGDKRHFLLPDLPTLKEQGIDVSTGLFRGLWAPPGTPKPIIDKLTNVLKKVSEDPGYIKDMRSLGAFPRFSPQQEYRTFMEKETEKYTKIAKKIGIGKFGKKKK